ncbi:MAG: alkaline phosphatase family protein [Gammaproteobacteria bacterium]|nr:MAG: alkaline phosphatase family protein [Gammaproteobacteria bacterium]
MKQNILMVKQLYNKSAKHCLSLLFIVVIATLVGGNFTIANAQISPEIRLVLQITVDGLRADLLNRYANSFGKGGFKYLMQNGTRYTNAHYQHANTETIVGHTTLATGTYPSQHGMVGNVIYDRKAGELSYNIEDAEAPLLPSREQSSIGDQVDPSQKISRTKGRSPRAIKVPTLADTLAAFTVGKSKIFGVSGKDRSAVAMAGHVGKAFWFSTDNGDFLTSRYYYERYPDWVSDWNKQRKAEKYADTEWKLSSDKSSYLLAEQDDRPYEIDLKGFGRTFPHRYGKADSKLLFTQLMVSSAGNELLLDFAKDLITKEQLGKNSVPDYLSISFSSVDAVNHFFGPSSLENEAVVRDLDKNLSELFKFIDKNIGLKHTLIVFSADHGMADMPEYMTELGYEVGRIDSKEVIAVANKAGKQIGIDEVVDYFFRPYIYLNKEKIASANLNHKEVEKTIADAVAYIEGINLAVSTKNFSAYKGNPLVKQVKRNHHASRSGDIYVIQDPYWFLLEKGLIAVMHGSPWRYDTHVPIMFSGPGIDAQSIHRAVHPVDVAPTLASLLGLTPPASSQGSPLVEVLQR